MTKQEMREPTFLVLSALAGGPKHGYALMAETHTMSEGRVQLKAGTLYAALDRLRDEGLVENAGEDVIDGRLRRYFKLTDDGAVRLEAEAARLQANARVAMSNLGFRVRGATS